MSYFERTEGSEDNLGNNPKFTPLEDLAVDQNLTPDEILMRKEGESEEDDITERIKGSDGERFDLETDFDAGDYNGVEDFTEGEIPLEDDDGDEGTVMGHTQDRIARSEFANMDKIEEGLRIHKYGYKIDEAHKPKPEKPGENRDSVRFKDAI